MKNIIRLKEKDKYFMNIALQEAAKANHEVFPNPKVGAIVVVDNNIISSGYHKCYGEEHAEANACLLYTSPSPRDRSLSRMPSSA